MRDTGPQQALLHAQLLGRMSPTERLNALRAIDRGVRRLVFSRLRAHYPQATEQELVMRHFVQVYGLQVAKKVYAEALPPDLQ